MLFDRHKLGQMNLFQNVRDYFITVALVQVILFEICHTLQLIKPSRSNTVDVGNKIGKLTLCGSILNP